MGSITQALAAAGRNVALRFARLLRSLRLKYATDALAVSCWKMGRRFAGA
jgi:hypothetical protein